MAFWDDVQRKATGATAKALQSAQNFSETTRLSSLVSEEERKINDTYSRIGKLYLEIHSNDPEDEFAEMVSAIKESEAKISDAKQQIRNIKGIRICENCGAEVPAGAPVCYACRTPMPVPQPPVQEDVLRCPKCGGAVRKGLKFCTACGNPMAQPQPVQPQSVVYTPPEPQPVQPQPAADAGAFCPNCGAHVEADMTFCTECGAKIN